MHNRNEDDFDAANRRIFIDEAFDDIDRLERLANDALQEQRRSEQNEVLRTLHSLKGNCSLFGLLHSRRLCHELETACLATPCQLTADDFLTGIDLLRSGIEGYGANGSDGLSERACERYLSALPQADDQTMLLAALPQLPVSLRAPLARLLGVDTESAAVEGGSPLAQLRALLSDAQGTTLAETACEQAEALIEQLTLPSAIATEVRQAWQTFRTSNGIDGFAQDILLDLLPEDTGLAQDGSSGERTAINLTGSAASTMRVSEASIDAFLENIGELVLLGDQLRVLPKLESADFTFHHRRLCEQYQRIVHDLESSIMAVRQVPIDQLFVRLPRLARRVARHTDKTIVVDIDGSDTRVDKQQLELLDEPLTHLVNNAVVHGIENPDERERSGKPRTGRVHVSARRGEHSLIITVSDDGAGIDIAALQERHPQLQERQALLEVIFRQGVSTSQATDEFAGRGIGMNVVQERIRAAGGQIQVQSAAGQGTTFTLQLPNAVTTEILTALLFRCANETYALPLPLICESFRLSAGSLHQLPDAQCFIEYHGQSLPYIDLRELLNPQQRPAGPASLVISVRGRGEPLALAVDAACGVQSIVKRPVSGLEAMPCFSGCCLTGDGQPTLIIDPDAIFTFTQRERCLRASHS